MSREYGLIYTRFWTDPDCQDMSDGAKLLFCYLLTGPHTTMAGCFRVPCAYIADDLKWSPKIAQERLTELFAKHLIEPCFDTGWVLVPNFLKYNPVPNPNCGTALARSLESLPKDFKFLSNLIDMLETVSTRLPREFLNGLRNRLTNRMPNQEQEQEQEQDIKTTCPESPEGSTGPVVTERIPFCLMPVNGEPEQIWQDELEKWQALYGGVDVRREVLAMVGYWDSKPKNKRKMPRGIRASIVNWLHRAQNEAPPRSSQASRQGTLAPRNMTEVKEIERRGIAMSLLGEANDGAARSHPAGAHEMQPAANAHATVNAGGGSRPGGNDHVRDPEVLAGQPVHGSHHGMAVPKPVRAHLGGSDQD